MIENFRITITDISEELGITRSTAGNRTNEAIDKGYVSKPHIRKRSYENFIEYVYLLRCKDPLELYLEYSKDERIVYHAVTEGLYNLYVISKEEIDIEGDVLISGPRSDYHVSFAPDHSWKTAIRIMEEKTEKFDPEKYEPKGTLQTHWDETIEWDEKDEILFRYFKNDLRKPVTPFINRQHISAKNAWSWLKKLPECCTIITKYYPETKANYDPYIFVFETDYEDFIIDLFSELPTSSLFFKVSDKLILYAHVKREFLRSGDLPMTDISKLYIPLLVRKLLKRRFISKEEHVTVAYHWRKDV